MTCFGVTKPPDAVLPSGFYVYIYRVAGQVRYVGKGHHDRAWHHVYSARAMLRRRGTGATSGRNRFRNLLAGAMARGDDIAIDIVVGGLCEARALGLEAAILSQLNRQHLWNIAEGGIGLTSDVAAEVNARPDKKAAGGKKLKALWADPEWRARMIAAQKEGTTDETRRALSEATKRRWSDARERTKTVNQMKAAARAMPAEARSARAKAAWRPENTEAMREAMTAAKRTPEARKAQSELNRRMWDDPTSGLRNRKPRQKRT